MRLHSLGEEMVYVIYWEKNDRGELDKRGFVSYDNPQFATVLKRDEYEPVSITHASRYKFKKDAQKTKNWYQGRGGFGYFIIMKLDR